LEKQQEIKIERKQGWVKVVPMQHCAKHAQGILHAANHKSRTMLTTNHRR